MYSEKKLISDYIDESHFQCMDRSTLSNFTVFTIVSETNYTQYSLCFEKFCVQ